MNQQSAQALIDGLSAQWQRERSESQMTLGGMIDRLSELPPELEMEGLGEPHSYRGYYSDLAFSLIGGKTTVSALLSICQGCMGEVFTGYKGGEFQMGRNTPVWVSNYGATGDRLMSIHEGGSIETRPED